jgi:hypothetical protein
LWAKPFGVQLLAELYRGKTMAGMTAVQVPSANRNVGCLIPHAAFLAVVLTLAFHDLAMADTADGATTETAITVPASNEFEGVDAEYGYIQDHYPGWHHEQQSLIQENGKVYDRIEIVGPDGIHKSIYFDITDWFGKP